MIGLVIDFFKKALINKKAKEIQAHLNKNQMLKESSYASNNNQVVIKAENRISHKENNSMKEIIQSMSNKENVFAEMCKVEK